MQEKKDKAQAGGPNKLNVLLATRDEYLKGRLFDTLRDQGEIRVVNNCNEAIQALLENDIDLVMFDPDLEGIDSIDTIEIVKKFRPLLPMIVITDDTSYETGIKIAEAGVYYNLVKPIDDDTTKAVLKSVGSRIKKTGN